MIYQTSDISEVYYGNINIVSGYVGNDLIFPSSEEPPTPPTPTVNDFLQFTAVDGDVVIGLGGSASVNVQYSFDKLTWSDLETPYTHITVTVPNGQTVYLKGNNANGFSTPSNIKQFVIMGTVQANGNVQSLLYESNFENLVIPNNSCFNGLFSGCTGLLTAPQLPATSITEGCYARMFANCTSLTTAPQLPATTLASSCYVDMFRECTSLTSAPQLPAMKMENYCYNGMFGFCSSLEQAPSLPATELASWCYDSMFSYCTSLTSAPTILPATTLESSCYNRMFASCTSLTTAPILPALNLDYSCYAAMFRGCTKLNYIKALFTTKPSTSYTSGWVDNVASNGTFVKNSAATWNVRGDDGIPNNWNIQYE
jgi:hypothetical protein